MPAVGSRAPSKPSKALLMASPASQQSSPPKTAKGTPTERLLLKPPPKLGDSSVGGLPTDLPPDAERVLQRRCKAQAVRELAVPLGEGWMMRAGRGSFSQVEQPGDKGPCMQLESAEKNIFLLTYDQNPDSRCVKNGHYRIEAHARTLPPASSREVPWFGIALDWNRSRSTVTQPCFVALVMSGGSWRLEQYAEGRQQCASLRCAIPASEWEAASCG